MQTDDPELDALLAHAPFVQRLARAALSQHDRAEDISQEAWVAAFAGARPANERLRTWFARVVRNQAAKVFRRREVRVRHMRAAYEHRASAAAPSPQAILETEEARSRLIHALMSLDARYRDPLLLRFYEDLPPQEIAARLSLSVDTVYTRLRRGIERLRTTLDRSDGKGAPWALAIVPLARLGPGATQVSSLSVVSLGSLAMNKLVLCACAVLLGGLGAYLWLDGEKNQPAPRTNQAIAEHAEPVLTGGGGEVVATNPGGASPDPATAQHTEGRSLSVQLPAGAGADLESVRAHLVWGEVTQEVKIVRAGPQEFEIRLDQFGLLTSLRRSTAELVMRVLAEGWQPFTVRRPLRTLLDAADGPSPIRPALKPGGGFTGVVRAEGGTPVPGAHVHIVQNFAVRTVGGQQPARLGVAGGVTADERGQFAFPATSQASHEIIVTSERHGLWRGRVDADGKTITTVKGITVRPVATIVGTVVSATGAPLSGVLVTASPVVRHEPATSLPSGPGFHARATARSNARGEYELSLPGHGLFDVRISDGFSEPRRRSRRKKASRVDTRTKRALRLELADLVPVRISFKDSQGRPVTGLVAKMFVLRQDASQHLAGATGGQLAQRDWAPYVSRFATMKIASTTGTTMVLVKPGSAVICEVSVPGFPTVRAGTATREGASAVQELLITLQD